ncbi:MAG: hypothetical protein IOC82_06810 [Aestuariivirga sp.]|uniref:hypothetical protein n=1 Tax=Aestuariivirga sp. TaxID=2650926 RepID=UPI0025C4B73B|nr:hypothetical protein [Aestuariivirga sp.]MCA3560725.1 hypothetical protein [Aestuariivirga sp.]
MRIITTILMSGAALGAAAGMALADGTVDLGKLAAKAAPAPPSSTWLMTISRTPNLEVPGLPMTTKEKNREGTAATTLRILPATGGPAKGSVSWSGYTRAGAVYHGSN